MRPGSKHRRAAAGKCQFDPGLSGRSHQFDSTDFLSGIGVGVAPGRLQGCCFVDG
jgi:hypothetical protein